MSPELLRYGIRDENWLEAKFFRKNNQGQPTLETLPGSYAVLRDIVRLCTLLEVDAGRYFLHAYDGKPEDHLALTRNAGGGAPRVQRGWLKERHTAGQHPVDVGDLTQEPDTFDAEVGVGLRGLQLKGNTTTLEIGKPSAKYLLYMTRIDSFEVTLGANSVQRKYDGSVQETPAGSLAGIRTAVAGALAK